MKRLSRPSWWWWLYNLGYFDLNNQDDDVDDDDNNDNENDDDSIVDDNKNDGDVFDVNDNYDNRMIVITKMKMMVNGKKVTKIMKIIIQYPWEW